MLLPILSMGERSKWVRIRLSLMLLFILTMHLFMLLLVQQMRLSPQDNDRTLINRCSQHLTDHSDVFIGLRKYKGTDAILMGHDTLHPINSVGDLAVTSSNEGPENGNWESCISTSHSTIERRESSFIFPQSHESVKNQIS